MQPDASVKQLQSGGCLHRRAPEHIPKIPKKGFSQNKSSKAALSLHVTEEQEKTGQEKVFMNSFI